MSKQTPSIIFYGTALIDLVISTNHEFLKEHNIEPDSLSIISFQKTGMLKNLEQFETHILPGGSCFNIMRMTNYLLNTKHNSNEYQVCAFGSVTDDKYGQAFVSQLKKENIHNYFQVNDKDNHPNSGLCAVICADLEKDGHIIKERSLLTDLGSSGLLTVDHVNKAFGEITKQTDSTKLCLIESTLIDNKDVVNSFINLSQQRNSHIVTNIFKSAFLTNFRETFKMLLETATIIFCNINEALFFISDILQITLDSNKEYSIEETSQLLASNLSNRNKNFNEKLFIITNSKKPSHAIKYKFDDNKAQLLENQESNTFHINEDEIIDTNGCGDSFLGGFLASFIQGKDLKTCLRIGNICGAFALKNSGFDVPKGKIETDLNCEISKTQ